jgi:hypothetical protein
MVLRRSRGKAWQQLSDAGPKVSVSDLPCFSLPDRPDFPLAAQRFALAYLPATE